MRCIVAVRSSDGTSRSFARPKSRSFGIAVLRDEDVPGLEVAVHDEVLVRELDGGADVEEETNPRLAREAACGPPIRSGAHPRRTPSRTTGVRPRSFRRRTGGRCSGARAPRGFAARRGSARRRTRNRARRGSPSRRPFARSRDRAGSRDKRSPCRRGRARAGSRTARYATAEREAPGARRRLFRAARPPPGRGRRGLPSARARAAPRLPARGPRPPRTKP